MDIEKKLCILNQLYKLHDDIIEQQDIICKKSCSSCCTCNVTMTTLEGFNIIKFLNRFNKKEIYLKLQSLSDLKKYRPKITTNGLADLCADKKNPPDEENDPKWGKCLFLQDGICTIYSVRPMGCRSMISKKVCSINGYADMDKFIITVNYIFFQFVEHMDIPGKYGNLTDILLFLLKEEHLFSCINNSSFTPEKHLLFNLPIKMLLIPPEHKSKAMPIIQSIQSSDIKEIFL